MTALEPAPLAGGILRVLRPDGSVAGAAFLVSERLAVTCAHMIRAGEETSPGTRVMVDVGAVDGPGPFPATGARLAPTGGCRRTGDGGATARHPTRTADGERRPTMGTPRQNARFPHSHDQSVWHSAVLRQQQGNGWLQFEQATDGRYAVRRGFSGAPVWDDELAAVVGMVVAADPGHPVAFLIPTDRLVAAAPSLRDVVGLPSPFPGLEAYQESNAAAFFGRDEETERITRLVLDHPLVTVLGASGCGKSSVVRAGVGPRLRQEGRATCVVPRTRDLLGVLAAGLTSLIHPEARGQAQRTGSAEPVGTDQQEARGGCGGGENRTAEEQPGDPASEHEHLGEQHGVHLQVGVAELDSDRQYDGVTQGYRNHEASHRVGLVDINGGGDGACRHRSHDIGQDPFFPGRTSARRWPPA
ncbi:ATP-binding protein [Streptomyces xiamenensis]